MKAVPAFLHPHWAFLRGLLKLILYEALAYDLLLFTFSMTDFIHT